MATIVLTTVGAVLGGPIGAAIGSMAGQSIDRRLFAPKGREGPRLTELAVQTSSYGAPIPQLFGTMRVAGQVVWATDLKESRDRQGGGKGRPSATTYSYSASFAVLLSARPIRAVRRIWADGTLLRGAAGDWKARATMRVHPGDEAQDPDPLIAATEGIGATPALRGQAYVVFEDLALADFGNRIPSLTFEVEADAGPLPAGEIAAIASGGLITSDVELPIAGYAAHGDTIEAAIGVLAAASGASFRARGGVVELSAGHAHGAVIEDVRATGAPRRGGQSVRNTEAIEAVPRRVTIAHHDPARDYQIGMQAASRAGAGRGEQRVDLAAALPADVAKRVAEAMLARALAARVTRRARVPWSPDAPVPGALVALAGDGGRWRVTLLTIERMVAELDLVRVAGGTLPTLAASPGRVVREPDLPMGATRIEAFELPPLADVPPAVPTVSIAVAGTSAGWRGAEVMLRVGGEPWAPVARGAMPSIMGALAAPLLPGAIAIADLASTIEVTLLHDALELGDADAAALRAGGNLALVGDELIQFARAMPLGDARWRLSGLLRGRRGTEAAMVPHPAATRFVLIEEQSLTPCALSADSLPAAIEAMASGVADPQPVTAAAAVAGRSVAPPAPVHARVETLPGGGLAIGWTRRSRTGWGWRDTQDAPLGESAERYRIICRRGDASVRKSESAEPRWIYPAAALAADRLLGPIAIDIAQIGDLATSAPLTVTIEQEDA